jgi:glycosyltransferase involved in cell wall biosynthesis
MTMEALDISWISPGFRAAETYPAVNTGIEEQIYCLARAMSRRGHRVKLYRRWASKGRSVAGVELVNVPVGNYRDGVLGEIPSRLVFSRKVKKLLVKEKPDIVHLSETFSGLFSGMSEELVRIYSTNNPDAMSFYRSFSIDYNRANILGFEMKRLFEERLIASVNTVFALNADLQKYVLQKRPRRVAVVPNGIETDLYHPGTEEPYILYAGKIDRVKGTDILIRAFSLIEEKIGVRLRLVGSGKHERQMRELAHGLGLDARVEFIPWASRETLRQQMSRCQVFVLPSRFETFGTVLLEAMACAKPVVATTTMGSRAIVQDKLNGILVQPEDPTALAEAMTILLMDEGIRRRLGNAARSHVQSDYDFRHLAAVVEGEYRRTLDSSASPRRIK